MGKIFFIMGKSSTGKDTIYKNLIENEELNLKNVIIYTTRPIRIGEQNGVEYYFTNEDSLKKFEKLGRVIEKRKYNTMHGPWYYFTVDDGQINLKSENYIILGTLESYENIRNYYGNEVLIPIYIEVEDGVRLERALKRERKQEEPKYAEMCRRFLADEKDFSEENIVKLGINKRYENMEKEVCIQEIVNEIKEYIFI